MMIAVSFDESNFVDDESSAICVFRGTIDGNPVVISCYKVTAQELEEINRTKRVWLGVMGQSMPSVFVAGTNPFNGPVEWPRKDEDEPEPDA